MERELLLEELNQILTGEGSIKFQVDKVHQIREKLDPLLEYEEVMGVNDRIKDRVQREAEYYWRQNGCKGAILMATGSGKSKVGVNIVIQDALDINRPNDLLVVPTEKLRDEGWRDEFQKWDALPEFNYVERACYASLNKYVNEDFDTVIFDEGHNLVVNHKKFFEQNTIRKLIWLSATKPDSMEKKNFLKSLGINPVYEITLDEAVRLGLVAPYDITIVTTTLDDTDKYIKAGSKAKGYFMQTEKANYSYINELAESYPSKQTKIKRMWTVYELKSKTEACKWLLNNAIPKELRTLIFCGTKKEAIKLSPYRFFSKPTKPKKLPARATSSGAIQAYEKKVAEYNELLPHWSGDSDYQSFKEKKITRLSCVEALNEGHNIPDLDCALIRQQNSNALDLWQRIGRTVRFKPGHTATIIIVCCVDTVDSEFVNRAIRGLNMTRIRWVSLEDLKSGKETIKFD